MHVFVYKSLRKADTYLYLREKDAFGVVPDAVGAPLGPLQPVREFDLDKLPADTAPITLRLIDAAAIDLAALKGD